mmetsp:Transcript_5572/g.7638  ORF Transcript_5572/g.7638 Transcript_5572/m.7638 type:complete len:94 (+) Transcript_5572:368-649(+)
MDQDEEFAPDLEGEDQQEELHDEDGDERSMDDEQDIDLELEEKDDPDTSQQSQSPERKTLSFPQSTLVTPGTSSGEQDAVNMAIQPNSYLFLI